MAFITTVPGGLLILFLESISAVTDVAVVSFGPELIVCNAYSGDGGVLSSSGITPTKTSVTEIEELKLPIDTILEQLHADPKVPDIDVVIQYTDVSLEIYPDHLEEADVVDEVTISSVKVITTEEALALPVKIDFPIKFFIDTDVFVKYLSELKITDYTIISYEEGKLFFANSDWSDRVEIPTDQFFMDKTSVGSFSSMHKTDLLKGISDILGAFASVKIAIGEDLPIVIIGYSPVLKIGYMISQVLESK